MTEDHLLRIMLTGEVFVCLILTGALLGCIVHRVARHWLAVIAGFAAVLVYALAGQAKSFLIGIPFDGFSWVGAIAFALLAPALTWAVWRERPHAQRRGR